MERAENGENDIKDKLNRPATIRRLKRQTATRITATGQQPALRAHAVYERLLFPETPDLPLPTYMLVVSFGLVDIDENNGPIEIAPGTHRMPPERAMHLVETRQLGCHTIPLKIGDVLIRHPWALHRGTPNRTDVPRALITVRYLRRWYADASREVTAIPCFVWKGLTPEQQDLMRFPIEAS